MAARARSPMPSEDEVDIGDALLADEAETRQNPTDLDFGFDILNGQDGRVHDDDEAFIASLQRSSNRKASTLQGKYVKKGGGFQAMGLRPHLLRRITRKGFSVPTPIQRKIIPLILDRKDVVGMARTGSGKTAAFVIPMIERLQTHSPVVGARALIMSPSRELAWQTWKVVLELSKGTDLKCVLLVGGDSLDQQFSMMTGNPDILIATPGRFLHLKTEMSLDLFSINYAVFDEADRLFEMGFAAQLTEILHALPPSRQTLLFSATLPSSLVEFARAGLHDPCLVRLDAETKISPDLESAFFSVKGAEKEGGLLHLLHDIIKMPLGSPEGDKADLDESLRKRKRGAEKRSGKGKPTEHSTIVFAATKHHVEYLAALLRHAGFAVSYAYGSLDQTARYMQVESFCRGKTNILVVTDVAARGIDIPVLANVINYDFPPQSKIFVHRVGRTARAGQRGWAYSLVKESDSPYLLDLQLFLGKKLAVGQQGRNACFTRDIVVGALKRAQLETNVEWVDKVLHDHEDMNALQRVANKAEKLYFRTRNSASAQSAKRSREMVASKGWTELHPLFGDEAADQEQALSSMLAKISSFRPHETVFELGPGSKTDKSEIAGVARYWRTKNARAKKDKQDALMADANKHPPGGTQEHEPGASEDEGEQATVEDGAESDGDMAITVSEPANAKKKTTFQDAEIFISYTPRSTNLAEEKGYGVNSGGTSFLASARDATMDLANDEGAKAFGAPTRAKMRWDKKTKKYVSSVNDTDGSRGLKMVTGESGVKIAASFKSGRFDHWRQQQRLGKPARLGEAEKGGVLCKAGLGQPDGPRPGGRRWHKQEKAPKQADKFRDDYHVRKKRVAEAREKRIGHYRDGAGSKREIKDATGIRKARELREQRRAKNARRPASSQQGRRWRA